MAKKFREVRKALRAEGWIKGAPAGLAWDVGGRRWHAGRHGRRQGLGYGPCWNARRDTAGHGTARLALKDYLVIYEQAEDGAWGAHSPDVEGAFALGQIRDEVEARMAEALVAHLAYLRESGRPSDPPTDAGRIAA